MNECELRSDDAIPEIQPGKDEVLSEIVVEEPTHILSPLERRSLSQISARSEPTTPVPLDKEPEA